MVINTKLEKETLEHPPVINSRKEKADFSELEQWIDNSLTTAFDQDGSITIAKLRVPHRYFQHILGLLVDIYRERGWKVESKYEEDNETYLLFNKT